MRKSVILVALVALGMLLIGGSALAYGGGEVLDTVRCKGGKCKGTPESDKMLGTAGRDIMYASKGSDSLYGKGGRDDLYGLRHYDTLYGGDGGDRLGGGDHRDDLSGGGGSDVLNGGNSADQLQGGDGNDELFGGSGGTENRYIENLDGGGGADLISGGPGFEVYWFDPAWGNDTISDLDTNAVSFFRIQESLNIELSPGPGPEATGGTNNVEWNDAFEIGWLLGGSGDDTITGNEQSNHLMGSGGSDDINGGSGDDVLDSAAISGMYFRSDVVPDTIDCGPGIDTVYFDPTRDTVTNCENLNPWQANNILSDPPAGVLAEMRANLADLRNCAGQECVGAEGP